MEDVAEVEVVVSTDPLLAVVSVRRASEVEAVDLGLVVKDQVKM